MEGTHGGSSLAADAREANVGADDIFCRGYDDRLQSAFQSKIDALATAAVEISQLRGVMRGIS